MERLHNQEWKTQTQLPTVMVSGMLSLWQRQLVQSWRVRNVAGGGATNYMLKKHYS